MCAWGLHNGCALLSCRAQSRHPLVMLREVAASSCHAARSRSIQPLACTPDDINCMDPATTRRVTRGSGICVYAQDDFMTATRFRHATRSCGILLSRCANSCHAARSRSIQPLACTPHGINRMDPATTRRVTWRTTREVPNNEGRNTGFRPSQFLSISPKPKP